MVVALASVVFLPDLLALMVNALLFPVGCPLVLFRRALGGRLLRREKTVGG